MSRHWLSELWHSIDYHLLPIRAGVLATFALIPLWYRLPGTPPGLTPLYVSRFLITLPMLWTIAWWLALRLPGFRALCRDSRRWWALSLLALVVWAFASTQWAFVKDTHPEIGLNGAVQLGLAALFAVATASAGPTPRAVAAALAAGLAWNSLLAGWQVAIQGAVGLSALGEFPISPEAPGISVLLAGTMRWLRPYGLLPHPNMLAGFLVVGLLSTLAGLFSRTIRWWPITAAIYLAGLWALLLAFSRAAWGGFVVGVLAVLPVALRFRRSVPTLRRRLLVASGLTIAASLLFVILYSPLLAARAGIGEERVELRSVADRVVFTQFAIRAIEENPVTGLGMANFPWRTSYYLIETTYELRGNNVHNIYLLVWAELGAVGFGLLTAALLTGMLAFRRCWISGRREPARLMLFSGVIALGTIGLLDHYPWTLIQFQAAWWGLLAVSLAPTPQPDD